MHAVLVLGTIKVAMSAVTALGALFNFSTGPVSPSISAPAGPLFTSSSPLAPGRDVDRVFTVGTSGAAYLGVYMTGLTTVCPVPDAASRLQLTVVRSGETLYAGTVADFASKHAAPSTALKVHPGSIDFRVRLDQDVDNSYQGCSSAADINWVAAQ